MSVLELLIVAIGLSMDAFAVAVCKGLSVSSAGRSKHSVHLGQAAVIGGWFGLFQGLMPLAGFLLGTRFERQIAVFDHWIAFVLLGLIGAQMLREGLSCETENTDSSISPASMLPLAVATSIDALAVGVTFAFLQVNILSAVTLIGVITFLLSMAGVKAGSIFGIRYKSRAEIAGGSILILMGVKILIEHLFL